MAKFSGLVGFVTTSETRPGIYEEVITEKRYYGDLQEDVRRFQSPDKVNKDVVLSNVVSIVADPYANENYFAIRYVTIQGIRWTVNDVRVGYPRINLSIGGVYTENTD